MNFNTAMIFICLVAALSASFINGIWGTHISMDEIKWICGFFVGKAVAEHFVNSKYNSKDGEAPGK